MKVFLGVLLLLVMGLMPIPAGAQMYPSPGMGAYGAMQSCPQGVQIPKGARDALDDVKQRQKELDAIKARAKKLASDKDKAEAERDRAKDDLTEILDGKWLDIITNHIDNEVSCVNYNVHPDCNGDHAQTDAGANTKEEAKRCARKMDVNRGAVWNQICDNDQAGTIVVGNACEQDSIISRNAEGRAKAKCAGLLNKYQKAAAKVRSLDKQLAVYGDERVDRATERVDSAKKRFEDALQEHQQAQTEGGICWECLLGGSGGGNAAVERKTDWGGVISNTAVGLLATYAGLQAEKNRAYYNAQIGFPTQQTYPSFMYGMPFFLNGFYGALGGGTAGGTFGCAGGGGMAGGGMMGGGMGGMGGGGIFGGYPAGYGGNPMGGGIYMPGGGMFPGMGGMGGLGMGMPGMMGMGGYGGIPGMGGMPGMYPGMGGMGGMPGMGMGGGLGMGMPGMGMGGGLGMGMPGMGMGGGMPGMYPGMGGMPGMGMGGGLGMGMPGMGMGGGMPGMYPGMGGMPGMGMGGGLGMGMPGMGMGGGMDGGLGAMQMQQQMMQMQLQYAQTQMQMQMRIQENYIQRQQVAAGLYQELQGLVVRINCVQSGANCGGGYLGAGLSTGIPGSSVPGGSLVPGSLTPGVTPGLTPAGGFAPPPGTNPGGSTNGGYVR